jgi:hypothetical protein
MDSDSKLGAISLIAVVVASIALLATLLQRPRDANEPPYIPSVIPYCGHLIGLFRHKMRYYVKVQ